MSKRLHETIPVNQKQHGMEDLTYKDTVRAGRRLPITENMESTHADDDGHGMTPGNVKTKTTPIGVNHISSAVDDRPIGHIKANDAPFNYLSSNDHHTAYQIDDDPNQSTMDNVADDNINDPIIYHQKNYNHRICQPQPKAVHVAGMNALLSHHSRDDNARQVRVEPAYLESSSGLHVLLDGQTMIGSMTLELEGFVPSIMEPHYLVPEENIQRIAHLYASVEPTHEQAPTSQDTEQHHRHRYIMRKYLNTICFVGVMIALIVSGIVVIAVCGIGICQRDSQESQNGQPYQSNYKSFGQENETNYKSFATKQQLVDAIDRFLSNQNTSELEETYGSIAQWNVSQIQDFSFLFSPFGGQRLRTSLFNEDVSRWDTSSATNMSYMFYGAQDFRGDISKWDVSRVTDMHYFMAQAYKFDGNLSQWDTSQFVNTSHMFYSTTNFSGIGLENWKVGRVYDMTSMFEAKYKCYGETSDPGYYCKTFTRFNRNLSNWDVSNVRYMSSMFSWASSFQGVGVEDWDTSKVETMSRMFSYALSFNANLSKWKLSNVQDMSDMFSGPSSFQGVGLEDWDTSQVETMSFMFAFASSFNANLSKWNVSKVQDTSYMFAGASSFQAVGVEDWDTSQVETMRGMFNGAKSSDANLSKWNVSNVQDTSSMFYFASSFQGVGVEDWDTSRIETMRSMFSGANLSGANLSKWNVSNVNDTSNMFAYASSFQGVGVEDWDTSQVETMSWMFYNATSFDANLSKWNVSNVQDASYMFCDAPSFQGLGVEDWDTSRIETMSSMFSDASSFDANMSKWNVSNVQDTSFMFADASSFKGVGVEDWNTSKVETMIGMFYIASSFDANLSSWDVGNVGDMSYMFQGATSFRGDGLEFWNVSHMNDTEFMFESAIAFHANLSNWDVSNVKNATALFRNATSFAGAPWWNETSDTIKNSFQ